MLGRGDGPQDYVDKDSVYEGDTEDEDQARHSSRGGSNGPDRIPDLESVSNTRRQRGTDYLGIPYQRSDGGRMPAPPRYDHYMAQPTFNNRGPSFKPEAYNGDEDWDSYISHFEVCAELGGWGQRDKALALAASLKGQARTYYMNLAPAERSSYVTVVYKLGQRFGNSRQHSVWLARLESRKRQPGESVATFGDDLRRMARRAYANFDSQAQETLALNQLYRAVSSEMKYRCVAAQCRTIADAVEMIETYEGIVGVEDKKKSTVRRAETSKKNKQEIKTNSQQENNSKIEKTLNQIIQRLDRRDNQQQREVNAHFRQGRRERNVYDQRGPRLCFKCNSPDHFIRNCPQNQEQKQEIHRENVPNSNIQTASNTNQGNENPSA